MGPNIWNVINLDWIPIKKLEIYFNIKFSTSYTHYGSLGAEFKAEYTQFSCIGNCHIQGQTTNHTQKMGSLILTF